MFTWIRFTLESCLNQIMILIITTTVFAVENDCVGIVRSWYPMIFSLVDHSVTVGLSKTMLLIGNSRFNKQMEEFGPDFSSYL